MEEASLNARRIALRDGIARQRPFAITGRGSFFARSGGRTLRSLLLITLSDTVRRTYIPSYTSGVYRSVTIYHWSAYIAILEQAYRQYETRARRTKRTEPTFSTDRELPRELAETDSNSNVQIARNYFPRRTIRHVCSVHELCAQTEINQEDVS